jgi:hypothetical protein
MATPSDRYGPQTSHRGLASATMEARIAL